MTSIPAQMQIELHANGKKIFPLPLTHIHKVKKDIRQRFGKKDTKKIQKC